jgi:hypothetical protein
MSHSIHDTPSRVFSDDCSECVSRSETIEGLATMDREYLELLAVLAAEAPNGPKPFDASWADMKAVDNLRLAGRLVYRSGITAETSGA